jgi:hypothetical protein
LVSKLLQVLLLTLFVSPKDINDEAEQQDNEDSAYDNGSLDYRVGLFHYGDLVSLHSVLSIDYGLIN